MGILSIIKGVVLLTIRGTTIRREFSAVLVSVLFKSSLFLLPVLYPCISCLALKVKNSILKSRNRCDQVMRTKSF